MSARKPERRLCGCSEQWAAEWCRGPGDWEWVDRGDVQELGGASIEADGSVLAVGAGEQNRADKTSTDRI